MSEPRRSAMALDVSSQPPLTLDIGSFHRARTFAALVAVLGFATLAVAWEWPESWAVFGLASIALVHSVIRQREPREALWGTLLLDMALVSAAFVTLRPPAVAMVTAIVYVVTAPILLTSGRIATRLVITGVIATSFASVAIIALPPNLDWTQPRSILVTLLAMTVFIPLIIWMTLRSSEQSTGRDRVRHDLEVSRRRVEAILEHAPVGMELTFIGPSNFIAVNGAFCDFLGYTADELLELSVPDVVHPEDLARTQWAADAMVAGELEKFHAERRYIRKDGQVVWASFSLSVIKDDDGNPTYAIGQVNDITRRKAAEAERDLLLELSLGVAEAESTEEAMQAVLARLAAAGGWSIGVLWVPSGGGLARVSSWAAHPRVDKWTETAERLAWGEGLVGAAAERREAIPVASIVTDPYFVAKAEAAEIGLDAALAVPVIAGSDLVGVLLFIGPPGVDPGRSLSTIQAVVSQLGQVIATRLAKEERDRMAAILEHTTDIAGMSSVDGRILYLNPAARALLSLDPDEDVSRLQVRDLHPPEVAELIVSTVIPNVLTTGSWRGETAFVARDGRVIPTSQVVLAHRDSVGRVVHLSTIARDITSQKLLEAHQQEIIRSKDDFIASVSHEIRTPLTAVRGFAEILANPHETLSDADRQEMIAAIASESADVSDIVEDLLVAARSDIDKLSVSLREVDLSLVVQETVSRLRWEGKIVTVDVEPGTVVRADPLRLRQILRNLLVNAVRYGGPEVRVAARAEGGRVLFHVMDNGSGVDVSMTEEIFAPYRRGHDRAGLPGSVGLGLSVSRRLARMMDGDVTYSVTDDWPTFTLHLPVF